MNNNEIILKEMDELFENALLGYAKSDAEPFIQEFIRKSYQLTYQGEYANEKIRQTISTLRAACGKIRPEDKIRYSSSARNYWSNFAQTVRSYKPTDTSP